MLKNIKNFLYSCSNQSAIVIMAIFIISFLLRLYGLGSKDFWYDEIYSVWYSVSPWQNWNAPFYWILLHFWAKIFGISEFSLRFPGMLFSFSTIAVVFLFAKKLFDKKTATLATLLIGLSSFHLWYAQEARDYSMVLFFGTLSSYLLFLAIKNSCFKRWVWFVIISLVSVYTNYFFLFLIIAQVLYVLYLTKFRAHKVWWYFLFITGAFSFYLPRFISKFLFVSEGFWVPRPNWQSLNIIFQNYMLGYNGTVFLNTFSSFLILALLIILSLAVCKKKEMRQSIYFCGFLLFIPLGLVFLFSKLYFSLYLNRSLLLFSPYFYLLVSSAVMELNNKLRVVLVGVLIFIFSCGAYLYFCDYVYLLERYHLGTYLKKPVRPIANFLDSNVKDGDLVAFTNESVIPGVNFYSKTKFSQYYFFSPQILVPGRQNPPKETSYSVPIIKISGLRFKRIWLIALDWKRNGSLSENSIAVKQWLDSNLKLLSRQELDGLWVYCYERNNVLN